MLRAALMVAALTLCAAVPTRADPAADPADDPETSHPTWLHYVWGKTPPTGVYYLPLGIHNDSSQIKDFELVGGIYKTVYGMTFINSYGDRTWSLGIERDVFRFHRLSIGYGLGVMYGYDGRLANAHRFPLAHTFLFEHAVSFAVGAPVHVDVTKHVQVKMFLTPVVTLVGLEFAFR